VHARPHWPQFALSEVVSVHVPLHDVSLLGHPASAAESPPPVSVTGASIVDASPPEPSSTPLLSAPLSTVASCWPLSWLASMPESIEPASATHRLGQLSCAHIASAWLAGWQDAS
jgi:hypothetical protein